MPAIDLTRFYSLERSQLRALCVENRAAYLEYLRKQIVDHDRIDILASEVLGYDLQPVHRHILKFQFQYPNNLQLAPRGIGKSTMGTIVKVIHYLVKYPKVRIALTSKTKPQAAARLKEIKAHLEGNELLIELFGTFYHRDHWNANSIEIAQRYDPKHKDSPGAKSSDATPSVMCLGARGSIAGYHFDVGIDDDLVDKTNSSTETVRAEFKAWYNGTYLPMFDPPDPKVPFRGDHHRVGTRYHYLDQYGEWIEAARKARAKGLPAMGVNVIKALDPETNRSPWPARFSVKYLEQKRRDIGEIAFGAQYQNSTDAMKGEIFDIENCIPVDQAEVEANYKDMRFSIGVDLAISEKQQADDFALVVLGRIGKNPKTCKYFVVESIARKIRFSEQTRTIADAHDRWNSVGHGVSKIGIEVVAYQAAQYQNLQDQHPKLIAKLRKIRRKPHDSKVARAHRLTALFERKQIYFPQRKIMIAGDTTIDTPHWRLRDQLILFPKADHDDLFDAFECAITADKRSRRASEERPELRQ